MSRVEEARAAASARAAGSSSKSVQDYAKRCVWATPDAKIDSSCIADSICIADCLPGGTGFKVARFQKPRRLRQAQRRRRITVSPERTLTLRKSSKTRSGTCCSSQRCESPKQLALAFLIAN